MSLRDDAIAHARSLCYLRDVGKIQMHVRNDFSFNLSRETVEQMLREYEARHCERRSFAPGPFEAKDDERDGERMIARWRQASHAMADSLSRYQGRSAA